MILDTDQLHGIVEIEIKLTDTSGAYVQSRAIVTRGFVLAEVGTLLQREAYELLRMVANEQAQKGVRPKVPKGGDISALFTKSTT